MNTSSPSVYLQLGPWGIIGSNIYTARGRECSIDTYNSDWMAYLEGKGASGLLTTVRVTSERNERTGDYELAPRVFQSRRCQTLMKFVEFLVTYNLQKIMTPYHGFYLFSQSPRTKALITRSLHGNISVFIRRHTWSPSQKYCTSVIKRSSCARSGFHRDSFSYKWRFENIFAQSRDIPSLKISRHLLHTPKMFRAQLFMHF